MRIGKRMREILNVLEQSDEPLTLREIIEKIKGLNDNNYHPISDGSYALYSRSAKLLLTAGLVKKGRYFQHYEGYPYKKLVKAYTLSNDTRDITT